MGGEFAVWVWFFCDFFAFLIFFEKKSVCFGSGIYRKYVWFERRGGQL